jgi:hypothetical protein
MRKYRANLFAHACSAHVEVISLNWARELTFPDGEQGVPNSTKGHSALFMKSNRFDKSDSRIRDNHRLGAYYSRWKEHQSDLCLLNHDEHVFYFVNQKAFLMGAAVQERRTGPEVRGLKAWNTNSNSWRAVASADDGFLELCQKYQTEHLNLCLDDHATPVDRERLLTLCAGTLNTAPDWHNVENIQSFVSEADERSKRLTFVHDENLDSRAFRNEHFVRFIELQTIFLSDQANFPPNIIDLRGNYKISFPTDATQFRCNVVDGTTGENGATVVYLGTQPASEAKLFYQRLRSGWGKRYGRMREELVRRLVVAYKDAQGIVRAEHPPLGSITDDSESPESISRTEHL